MSFEHHWQFWQRVMEAEAAAPPAEPTEADLQREAKRLHWQFQKKRNLRERWRQRHEMRSAG